MICSADRIQWPEMELSSMWRRGKGTFTLRTGTLSHIRMYLAEFDTGLKGVNVGDEIEHVMSLYVSTNKNIMG